MNAIKIPIFIIYLQLFFLFLNRPLLPDEVIVGEENSEFIISRYSDNIFMRVRSITTQDGPNIIETKALDNPYIGNSIAFINENGEKYFSTNTQFPITFIETFKDTVYTLEEQIYPNYAMRVAFQEADLAKGIEKGSELKYINWRQYYLRKYDTKTPGGNTLFVLPKLEGPPSYEKDPIALFPTSDAIYLLYLNPSYNSLYNLLIEKYSLNENNSKSEITIHNISCGVKRRVHFIKENSLFFLRTLKNYDITKEREIVDLVKVDLQTGNTENFFRSENVISCGIDNLTETFYYITSTFNNDENEPCIYHINWLPLNNLNGSSKREKFSFHLAIVFWWDDNFKRFYVKLRNNNPKNKTFQEGGIYSIERRSF